jgi:hypothetical protein
MKTKKANVGKKAKKLAKQAQVRSKAARSKRHSKRGLKVSETG